MIQKVLSKEFIRYGISGLLITLINLGVYTGLLLLGIRYEIANIIALVMSRMIGFALSKYFVFRSTIQGRFWREFWGFMVTRGFSGLVDYFGLILLVNQFHMHEVVSKGVVMALVIVLNYVLGKFLVFRNGEPAANTRVQSENEQKYRSKNPLRRFLVLRLIDTINSLVFGEEQLNAISAATLAADVLDAGCGEGFVVNSMHAAAPEKTIVGLDVSQSALEIAKQNNPNVPFLLGLVYSLPFGDASVQTVLLSEVLEHLETPILALREVERVAASTVVITVPNEPWFSIGNLLSLRHVSRLGNPVEHINHWTYRGFQTLICENMHGTIRFYRCFPWSIALIKKDLE